MVGDSQKNDKNFDPAHYEEFYENHHFQPLSDEDAFNAHEVIPRFSWAFDKIEEMQENRKTPLRVLDLGCLDGSFLLTVCKHLNVEGTGVDLTKDGIAIAEARAKEADLDAQFYQGKVEDFLTQKIMEGTKYDVVTWFEIIEHVDDPTEVQSLIDGVLEEGGTIMCSTPAFESPTFGKDDEQNKCHVRLYTMAEKDYEAENKYGHVRKATSFPAFLGDRIKEMAVYSELINVLYQ